MSRLCLLLLGTMACVLLGAHNSAQEGALPSKRESVSLQRQRGLVEDRERGVLFPRDRKPMEIVGLSQGDNDFRARTPALQKSDMRSAQVDLEQLRERMLAAYSGKSNFSTALGLATGSSNSGHNAQPAPPTVKPEPQQDPAVEAAGSSLEWLLAIPLGVLVLLLATRKLLVS